MKFIEVKAPSVDPRPPEVDPRPPEPLDSPNPLEWWRKEHEQRIPLWFWYE